MQTSNLLFISMSDAANGAENVLFMAANVSRAPFVCLQRVKHGNIKVPDGQLVRYISSKSMLAGFWGVVSFLKPYRKGFILISTHPYLNAYLGFLRRIGYLKSQLIVRECTSVFNRYFGLKKFAYKLAYYLGYPAVNLVVCQTQLMRKQFLENITFVKQEKIIVQQNPINLKQVMLKATAVPDDADLNTDFICAAGRLIPEKGFAVLIEAFQVIVKQYPGLKLLLLGEGPEQQFLNDLIEKYGLTGKAVIKGRADNPMPYFRRAKVCVVSSIREGFPNVLLEMMALNPMVVSTLCAGGIEDMEGVFKAKVNDIGDLTEKIQLALKLKSNPESELVLRNLIKRSPQNFIESILAALQSDQLVKRCDSRVSDVT